jgi:hypothetical protein
MKFAYEYGRHAVLLAGRIGASQEAFVHDEWHRRHALNRLLARWCVGHRLRAALVAGALEQAVARSAMAPRRFQFLLCSALFNVMYWAGVADATGLGSGVWRGLIERPSLRSSPS